MKEQLTEQELEIELRRKSEAIDRHVDGLEDEVTSTPAAIKQFAREHPLLMVGGTVAAGLCIGALFSGRRKRKRRRVHQKLIDQYVDVLSDEVRHISSKGERADAAVRRALEDRVPLILYTESADEGKSDGFFREAIDLILKTALGFAIKEGLDVMSSKLGLEEQLESVIESTGEDFSTAATAASEAG